MVSGFCRGFVSKRGTACRWLGSCVCSLRQAQFAGVLDMC